MKCLEVKGLVKLYVNEQIEATKSFPFETVAKLCKMVVETYELGGTIYVAANGGQAGLGENLVCDLLTHPFASEDKARSLPDEVKKMKAVNLASSPAMLTGTMNDFGQNFVFARQMDGHIGPNDLFLGLSGSGNSPNILEAITLAKRSGATTVIISRGNGGKCRALADLCIIIPGTSTFPGQTGKNDNNFHFKDCYVSISHMVVGVLWQYVREKYKIF